MIVKNEQGVFSHTQRKHLNTFNQCDFFSHDVHSVSLNDHRFSLNKEIEMQKDMEF